MLDKIFVFGFNHQSTSEEERGSIAFSDDIIQKIYALVDPFYVPSLMVLQTCNRSEVYGYGDFDYLTTQLKEILSLSEKKSINPTELTNQDALTYIFEVAAGLQSQIVGDLEILGQFKKACKLAKVNGRLDGSFEKCINIVIQSAKEVRSGTKIMDGTISLSYAVVKLLKSDRMQWKHNPNVLIIGAGEFARKICKEITAAFPEINLIIANRNKERAININTMYGGTAIDLQDIPNHIQKCSVVISAIHNPDAEYVVQENKNTQPTVFIDLSIPKVIHSDVVKQQKDKLYVIDDAAQIINSSISKRHTEIPTAQLIVQKHIQTIVEWSQFYEKRASLSIWKDIVHQSFQHCPLLKNIDSEQKAKYIKKGVTDFSIYLRQNASNEGDASQAVKEFQKNLISPSDKVRPLQSSSGA